MSFLNSRSIIALGGAAVLALSACGSDEADSTGAESVSIAEQWSREPVDGQSNSAVYGVLTNDGDSVVTAVSATSSATDTVELHEVVMNDEGQMTMREKDGGYEIPAGGSITLEPGGLHIMMLGIDPATYPDPVPVTLEFDDGSSIEFTAEVRAVDGMAMDMDHGDMEMDEMDHSEMEMDDGAMDEMDDGAMDEMEDGEG